MIRWHPIDHEHEWRKAVIERLDHIAAALERIAAHPSASHASGGEAASDPHLCAVCGRSFDSEHALKVHMARAHRE